MQFSRVTSKNQQMILGLIIRLKFRASQGNQLKLAARPCFARHAYQQRLAAAAAVPAPYSKLGGYRRTHISERTPTPTNRAVALRREHHVPPAKKAPDDAGAF
jgi:hypothetical protein